MIQTIRNKVLWIFKAYTENRGAWRSMSYTDRSIVNNTCLESTKCFMIQCKDPGWCGLDRAATVELSDERGVVKNLRQFPQEYAKAHVRDREILVLLKVENADSSVRNSSSESVYVGKVTYTPLLTSLEVNSEFMETLNPPREEESLSEISSKSSRRRSSTLDIEELKANSTKAKSKTTMQSLAKKPTSKRGHRPPLRKTTTAS